VSEATDSSGQGLAAHSRRSLRVTRRKLELAVRRLVNGIPRVVRKGANLSASSVAEEAGVDRATLYRFHEPVLTDIRRINDSGMKAKLGASRAQTHEATFRVREYRKLVEQAQAEVAALARINYHLQSRIQELEGNVRVRDERIAAMQRRLNAQARTR
jgi:hypothetical protein